MSLLSPNRFRPLQLAVTVLVLGACAPAGSSVKPTVDARDDWYLVKISGSPVGFASEVVSTAEDGSSVIFRSHMDLSLARMGTPMKMFMMAEEVCEPTGRFQRGTMEMNASITGADAVAELNGDVLTYSYTSGGNTETREIPWAKDAVTQWEASERVRELLDGSGDEITFTMFDINDGRFKETRAVRGETADEVIDGKNQTLRSVIQYQEGDDTPVSTAWYDDAGTTYRTVIKSMGMEIIVERIRAEDMASIDLDPNFDIIRQSMIPVAGFPEPLTGVDNVTMRLNLTHPVRANTSFEGPNQVEMDRGDTWVDLKLTRDTNPIDTDGDVAAFTESDFHIQSDNPEIVAIADSIRAATNATGWELARELAAWVNAYIENKNFEQGFASALEVLHTRAGDCTEHSLLLTALLRASDIPARPAVGLVYQDGQFVGHMWAEAWVGQWRTLDALDLKTNPIRIRVTSSRDGRAVDERSLVRAYSILGGMTVDVTDFSMLP